MTINQNPEQMPRERIDELLRQAGWAVQSKDKSNFNAAKGIAVREYTTSVGPAVDELFVNLKPVGIIETKTKYLIQMTTGADKTFTATTFIYRLSKFDKAKRILFLVDSKNLSEQAIQEFMALKPNDNYRKFTDLYIVQRLSSSFIASDFYFN